MKTNEFNKVVQSNSWHLAELQHIRNRKIDFANSSYTRHKDKMIQLYDYAIQSLKCELITKHNYKIIAR